MKSRISRAVAGLSCLLAAHAGVVTAATDSSDPATAGGAHISLRIELEGQTVPKGPEFTGAEGRFTLVATIVTRSRGISRSDEIVDRGTFRDSTFRVQRFGRHRYADDYPYVRTLRSE